MMHTLKEKLVATNLIISSIKNKLYKDMYSCIIILTSVLLISCGPQDAVIINSTDDVSQTQIDTQSQTVTDTVTQTNTVSQTQTQTEEITQTVTDTVTQTNTVSQTQTQTHTEEITETITQSETLTQTQTQENTSTNTDEETNLISGYEFAALENETLELSGIYNVAYGADGEFFFLENQSGALSCNSAAFGGDPIRGVRKGCYIKFVTQYDLNSEQLFSDENCQLCHAQGQDLPNLNQLIESDTLENYIVTDMPPNNASACIDECAKTLAQYIKNKFAFTPPVTQTQTATETQTDTDTDTETETQTDTQTQTQTDINVSAAQLYEQKNCEACHAGGSQLPTLTSRVENNTLVSVINNQMPPNNTDSCIDECAQILADYIEQLYYIPTPQNGIEKSDTPIESYLRKAKLLVAGSVVTEQELQQINNDPESLPDLIRTWQNTQGYTDKMSWFLEENLQFSRSIGPEEYVGQLRGDNKANPPTKFVNPKIYENGYDSAIKTIMELIIAENKPFTDITTQDEWMMTPALMSLFLAFDYPNEAALLDFKIGVDLTDAEKQYSMQQKIDTKRFYFPAPEGAEGFTDQGGNVQTIMNRKEVGFVWGALNQYSEQTSGNHVYRLFKFADYTTWKKVKIVKATEQNQPLRFWDLPSIREADTLYLNTERLGFFTHPNFLGRWETNDDNQWRVTINQALITALNLSFAGDDVSITISEEAITPDHAAPGTDCYGCHRLLDPMRNYFRNNFDDSYGKPRTAEEKNEIRQSASFSFKDYIEMGSELKDLGNALAAHPHFAKGWVQKLCTYANSQSCIETDEDFLEVAQAFEQSNFNFNELIVAFFSSGLITKDIEETSQRAQPAYGSISRYQHTCQLLQRRLSDYSNSNIDPCVTGNANVKTLASNIPQDEWTRGSLEPATPTRPNMFSYTTMENMCSDIAKQYYNTPAFLIDGINPFLDDYLLPVVLGLPVGDSRRASVRTVLKSHHTNLVNMGGTTQKDRLVSVFTLGCSSALLSAIDF